ncbi:MAG: c-type cytochrome [Cellvibrionaceae bacterium]
MNKRLSLFFKPLVVTSMMLLTTQGISADEKAKAASVDYRQSTFKMVKWHMGPMAGMVKGKVAYDAAAFSSHAGAMASLSHLAENGFLTESPAENSRSKANIWKNKADFDKKMQAFVDASDKLVVAAKSNNLDTIKPAFGALGKSCKGCHDEYRAKKK